MYGKIINKKHGEGTADKLYVMAKAASKCDCFYYAQMIKFYTKKIKDMGSEKYWK